MDPSQLPCDDGYSTRPSYNTRTNVRDDHANLSISAVISTSCIVLEGLRDIGCSTQIQGQSSNSNRCYPPRNEHPSTASYVPPTATYVDHFDDISPSNNTLQAHYGNSFFESAATEFTTSGCDNIADYSAPYRSEHYSCSPSLPLTNDDCVWSRPYNTAHQFHANHQRKIPHRGVESEILKKTDSSESPHGLGHSMNNENVYHKSGHNAGFPEGHLARTDIPHRDDSSRFAPMQDHPAHCLSQNEAYWDDGPLYPSCMSSDFDDHGRLSSSQSFQYGGGQIGSHLHDPNDHFDLFNNVGLSHFNASSSSQCPAISPEDLSTSIHLTSGSNPNGFDTITGGSGQLLPAGENTFLGDSFLQVDKTKPQFNEAGKYDRACDQENAAGVHNNCLQNKPSASSQMKCRAQARFDGNSLNTSPGSKADEMMMSPKEYNITPQTDPLAGDCPTSKKSEAGPKVKPKGAETVETLQQQLELMEERRKKLPISSNGLRYRINGGGVTNTSDSDSATSVVDVDHMISSGVTVAGFKPRAIIRKRSKTSTPSDVKNMDYWQKRRKNNDSARKSRESKKEKEKNFYKRALELEYENFYLQECLSLAEAELAALGHQFVPPVFGHHSQNSCY